jgi:hypothetical protein
MLALALENDSGDSFMWALLFLWTNMYRVFGKVTYIHIISIHIECFVQTNYMISYRIEIEIETNLYRIVSCRNDVVRDDKYCISCRTNTYRVFGAET